MKQKLLIIVGIILAIIVLAIGIIPSVLKKYSITFITNGGNAIEGVQVIKGTTIGDLEVPIKEGYTFLHWTYNGKICNSKDEIRGDMILVANWEKNENTETYTVTFDSAGGNIIASQNVEKGKLIEEPNKPTKEGYTFIEWTLNDESFNFNTIIVKDITLVANWKKNEEVIKTYTITFNSDGGTKISSKTIEEGKKVAKPTNPTKKGYEFLQWNLASTNKKYDFDTTITKDITLVAIWKKIETNGNSALESALKKLKNASSFTHTLECNSNIDEEKVKEILKFNTTTKEHETIMYINDSIIMHSYAVLEESKLIGYVSTPLLGSSDWIKTLTIEQIDYDTKFLDELLKIVNSFDNKGNGIYTTKLDNKSAIALYKVAGASEEQVEITNGMNVKIALNSNNIKEIVLDISNSLKIDGQIRKTFIINMNFSNINNTKIIVPEDVKANAKTFQ